MMQKSKYKTITEYTDANEVANGKLGKILVLPEHDIDILIEQGVFYVDDRQVWYSDTRVFPTMSVELPKDATLIEINKVECKKNE